MPNLKNITDLPVVESAEGLNLIVNDNGSAKQVPATAIGGSGGADWNAKEGEPGYVKNRPFWKETVKVQTIPDLEMPLTLTTESYNGLFYARDELEVVQDTKNYVVFDGIEYECEPYYSESFGTYAIGDENFVNYPFCIFGSAIVTETEGTHTIEQYYEEEKVIADYSPCLVVMTEKATDKKPYIRMEDVEKIKNAYNNGIPVWLNTSWENVVEKMQVSNVTNSFIFAFGCFYHASNCTTVVVRLFSINDGSLYREGFSVTGSIYDNGNYLPVMNFNNRQYKITIGDSGNLVATEIT